MQRANHQRAVSKCASRQQALAPGVWRGPRHSHCHVRAMTSPVLARCLAVLLPQPALQHGGHAAVPSFLEAFFQLVFCRPSEPGRK